MVNVLDCTLRDGGYCNQWKFGKKNQKKIVSGLIESGVEIVECGFLTNKVIYDENISKYVEVKDVISVIPNERRKRIFVVMLNYGEYDLNELPQCDEGTIDGIRVAFHKKDLKKALEWCHIIKEKGYKVFVQPMVSMNYSDEEFLELIKSCNVLEPYAFYIVDSFGMMKQNDLIRLFYLVEHNLKQNIKIGYHSHNNMQLAFSNALTLLETNKARDVIIDASIFGMGRGAGNLNTELLLGYLNERYNFNYSLEPILNIIDEIIMKFYNKNYWGYSLPNYLSALYNTHPNYADYFERKKTLTVADMNEIFSGFDEDKKVLFDKTYAEKMYIEYMSRNKVPNEQICNLLDRIKGKTVLLIAPGKSVEVEKEKVLEAAKEKNVITVSINFEYKYWETDYIFVSNLRRFRNIAKKNFEKVIATSNIRDKAIYFKVDYSELLNDEKEVEDNAGLMAIKFFEILGVEHLILAGIDGYSYDMTENFAEEEMVINTKKEYIDRINAGMQRVLKRLQEKVKIDFLTTSRFRE